MERAPTGKLATNALRAVQVVSLFAIAGCAYTMFGRLGYQCELEWMTGSVYDHIERIRDGKSVYTAPSLEWTPGGGATSATSSGWTGWGRPTS